MKKFVNGEIVVLISGGPKMTVTETNPVATRNPSFDTRCIWFDESGCCHEDLFPDNTLMQGDKDD